MKIEVSARGLGVFATIEVVDNKFILSGHTYTIEEFKQAQDYAWHLYGHILKLIP